MGATIGRTESGRVSEYAVYTYGISDQEHRDSCIWEKKASHAIKSAAVRQAEDLYRTGQYMKVEIKQKYFDSRKNRNIGLTLKTLQQKKNPALRTVMAIALALIFGFAVFGMIYFPGRGF